MPRPCGETLKNTARARGGRGGGLRGLLCPVEKSGYFVNGNKVFQVLRDVQQVKKDCSFCCCTY